MSESLLIDKYGRQLSYLRLSVTDRCNFRCYYCMPEEGMNFAARQELLSFEELYQLSALFCSMGVNKIRITGGEPFVRAGIIPFLRKLSQIPGLEEITVTSNGTLNQKQIKALQEIGIRKINISLDSLDRERFFKITRRDSFDSVFASIFSLMESGFDIKLNCVVAENKNIQDIVPFVELTKDRPIAVRFLEEMPFNGSSTFGTPQWSHREIYQHITNHYPTLEKLQSEASSTSVNYKVPGYAGSFGIIPSFSRTFCGTCNRIRLGATGELRTCLYGPPATNLRDVIRSGNTTEQVAQEILEAVSRREKDGFAAEASHGTAIHESMSVLGG
ncbi:GTP 3',8-cyclase MoaA [Rufibacter tibetensis]|uniref:GTP 3',8-cyclase n=1 Tax=Rufibacter tibetensis TaxID=512763 RepID=A0A0P0C5R1_9BACT|nr:GTP 3',8-cyclase MoaA [Rufibacter tibetensis]ALJ00527.1 cyclic pyranopterin phosphate synthase MoaA [Rufibacter tibetensis]